ncbi:SDR family oxidoreductase [Herbaspirillum frisingense]|uniref:SDR family oxidoreductase n=1 Tax=Herbaspirillum frisingense TaxID=92645 RepID=UPI0016043EED|nr:SDR family oxidoreductase [Herbaspirillum frisingense]QNB06708.1 SDR family oxidoreductase [Herbaspirillum frisingense]
MAQKIAFITGANRGIGFEMARRLGKLGITPVLGVRDVEAGRRAVDKLAEDGVPAEYIRFDAAKQADQAAAYQYLASKYGYLDVLINNAGVHLEGEAGVKHLYDPSTTPMTVLRDTFETNVLGVIGTTQALLPLLRKASSARIVNMSSILGSLALAGDPASPIYTMKSLAYDTSKAAVNSFTIQLAYELRDEPIKVNSAHPGWVQTEMGGSAAPMPVEEGAETGVLLATLPDDGPSGGFFHKLDPLPW